MQCLLSAVLRCTFKMVWCNVSLQCTAYAVTRCTPVLENLEPVLEKLNQGGDDFRGFVRRVRKLFLALV